MLFSPAPAARADTFPVWTGAVNTDWNNPGNWSTGVVPVVGDTITLGSNVTAPLIDTNGLNMYFSQLNITNTNTTTIYPASPVQDMIIGPGAASVGITVAANAGPVNISTTTANVSFNIYGPATITNNSTNLLNFNNSGEFMSAGTNASSVVTFAGPGNTTFAGYFGNNGANTFGLIKNGSGTLQLTGNPGGGNTNFWTGGFVINAGVVGIAGGNTVSGATGGNTLYLNGGNLYLNATAGKQIPKTDNTVIGGDFTFGISTITNAPLTFNGPVDLGGTNHTLTVVGSTVQFGGGVTDGGLVKSGPAALSFVTTPATYAGPTIINQGSITAGTGTPYLLSPNSDFVVNGGTLALSTQPERIGSLAGTGQVTLGDATSGILYTGNDNASTTFSGVITGAGANGSGMGLVKEGSGIFSLAGTSASTFMGSTTVSGGTLAVLQDSNLGDPSNSITVNAGTLMATGTFTTARTVNLNDPASTLDATAGNTFTLATALAGSGALIKGTSAGTVQLAQPTGYTTDGDVVVNGGTLAFGGTAGAVVPLSVGGTLNVADGAVFKFLTSATAHTANTIGTLNLNNAGLLDVANVDVSLGTSVNTLAQVRTAIHAAYAGGSWSGTSGITSSSAKASPSTIGIAYTQNTNTATIGLRPSLIGDTNGDGKVNGLDTRQIYTSGAFNDGQATHNWSVGDMNYDGLVNGLDTRLIYTSGNFNNAAQNFTAKLTSPAADPTLSPMKLGPPGDGIPDVVYSPGTGDISFTRDGYTGTVVEILLHSDAGVFNVSNFNASTGATANVNTLDVQSGNGFTTYDFGNVLPAGLTDAQVLAILSPYDVAHDPSGLGASGMYIVNDGNEHFFDVQQIPEPACLSLAGLAAAGLLARKRRR